MVTVATMAVVPAPLGVATPVAEMLDTTAELLDVHTAAGIVTAGDVPGMTYGRFMFTVAPDAVVPMAMKLTLAPTPVVRDVCVDGIKTSETIGSGVTEMATVNAALAATIVPSGGLPPMPGFGTTTVMAATPLATAENCPGVPEGVGLATARLLLLHTTPVALVRFTVVPEPVVPMAMKLTT